MKLTIILQKHVIILKTGDNLEEADEQPSNEFARADDDDFGQMGLEGASGYGGDGGTGGTRAELNNASEDEFTYSYGDVLSSAAVAVANAGCKSVDEVKLETSEAIVVKPSPPISLCTSTKVQSAVETNVVPRVSFDLLMLNIHRLPGETLGMHLKLGNDGRVLVGHVNENGAAERASDSNGNRCPVKIRDEIVEINGVSLSV